MQLNSSNPQMHTSQANDITDHNEWCWRWCSITRMD
jgi:hypothetical protein